MVTMTIDFAAENQFINARDAYERRGGGHLPFPDQVALDWLREFYPRGPWTIDLVKKAHQYFITKLTGPEDLARVWLTMPPRPGETVVIDETEVDYANWPYSRIPEGARVFPPPPGTFDDAPYNKLDWEELSRDVANVMLHDADNFPLVVYGDGYLFQKPLNPQQPGA